MSQSSFLIREIKPEDNQDIEVLIHEVFTEFEIPMTGSSIEDDDVSNMSEAYSDPRASYFVIERQGKVLGGAGIKQLQGAEEHICELQKMYFSKEIRGLGYGKKMFDLCMESARSLGYTQCYLESASQLKAAIHMYEKNGFIRLDKPMGETGHYVCGVWMVKELI